MVRWTERAAADLIAIGEYIAADNTIAARSWVERIRERKRYVWGDQLTYCQ